MRAGDDQTVDSHEGYNSDPFSMSYLGCWTDGTELDQDTEALFFALFYCHRFTIFKE